MAARMIRVSPLVELLVARARAGAAKESGWWVMRSYHRGTHEWRDYPVPGRGPTLWLTSQAARKYGLAEQN
jgi:hypothetical protein